MLQNSRLQFTKWNRMQKSSGITFFLTEKKDGRIKARYCAKSNPQQKWMNRDEVSSQTVTTEATIFIGVIEALVGRDVAKWDIPKAFVQNELNELDLDGHRTIMKTRVPLIDILKEVDSEYGSLWLRERMKKYYMYMYARHSMACWYQQCYSTSNQEWTYWIWNQSKHIKSMCCKQDCQRQAKDFITASRLLKSYSFRSKDSGWIPDVDRRDTWTYRRSQDY